MWWTLCYYLSRRFMWESPPAPLLCERKKSTHQKWFFPNCWMPRRIFRGGREVGMQGGIKVVEKMFWSIHGLTLGDERFMIPLQKSFEHKKTRHLHVLRRLAAHISGKSKQLNMWCLRFQFWLSNFKNKAFVSIKFFDSDNFLSPCILTNLLEIMDWIICYVFVKF